MEFTIEDMLVVSGTKYQMELITELVAHHASGLIINTDQYIMKVTEAVTEFRAIEEPENMGMYEKDLIPYFDVDGSFQIILISTGDLDIMDTVERRHIAYKRARVAVDMALRTGKDLIYFDEMGIYRLISMVPDRGLLKEMGDDLLRLCIPIGIQHYTGSIILKNCCHVILKVLVNECSIRLHV